MAITNQGFEFDSGGIKFSCRPGPPRATKNGQGVEGEGVVTINSPMTGHGVNETPGSAIRCSIMDFLAAADEIREKWARLKEGKEQ